MLLWGRDFAASTDQASVLRMSLEGGIVDWSYTFQDGTYMADITQKLDQDVIHGCGYGSSYSIIFRLDTNRGDVKWIKKVGSGVTEKCRGIVDWKDTSTGAD